MTHAWVVPEWALHQTTYDDRRKGQPCSCGRVVSHGHPWGKRCGAVLGCRFEQRPARQVVFHAQPDSDEGAE